MMPDHYSPLDYLVIGHVACDLTSHGNQLGGTVAYASLTAHRLGQQTGIVTAWGDEGLLNSIAHIPRAGHRVSQYTTFENQSTLTGRIQTLHYHAPVLTPDLIPLAWQNTPLVHFGPIVHEIDPGLLNIFPNSFIGLTPQGWFRKWDQDGHISFHRWTDYAEIFSKAHAVVISIEDIAGNERFLSEMVETCPVFVVTEGKNGARLFLDGIPTYIPTSPVSEIDSTGAGDIFATAFFIHFHRTNNPVKSAYFATQLAAHSVKRIGLNGIPKQDEIHSYRDAELFHLF